MAGPRPGGPGRAVITGHIDSPEGLGAFAALDSLHDGATIELSDVSSDTHSYHVTDRQEVEKAALDPAILSRDDGSDLLLITCIGNFDRNTLSYDSNLLITAVPDGQNGK